MEKGYFKSGYTVAVFTDIEGAFDNLNFKAICQAIKENIKEKHTVDWYLQMLENRLVTEDTTTFRTPQQGTPQGAIISPTVWNLGMNLAKLSKRCKVKIVRYADDEVLLMSCLLYTSDAADE